MSDRGPPPANPFTAYDETVMRRRNSLKWRSYDADVLPMWVAEMDIDPAPVIVEAAQRALRDGGTGYPHGSAMRDAFVGFAAARWGWHLDPGPVVEVADVLAGLGLAVGLVTEPGDPVVITTPVWPPFAQLVRHLGRDVVPAALGPDGRLDFATLEEAFDRSTWQGGRVAMLLCSPHNPTGAVHTRDELGRLAALAERYRVRVVADEVHAPLTFDPRAFVPYLSVAGSETGFAVTSATKAWNIAGLKAGLLVPGAAAAGDAARLPDLARYGASTIGMVAHAAAFADGAGWLETHLAGLTQNRAQLVDLVARSLPAVGLRPPQATYFGWLDCRALDLRPDPSTAFLERGRVALSAGETFVAGGDGFARLNFAAAPVTIQTAILRMAEVAESG